MTPNVQCTGHTEVTAEKHVNVCCATLRRRQQQTLDCCEFVAVCTCVRVETKLLLLCALSVCAKVRFALFRLCGFVCARVRAFV